MPLFKYLHPDRIDVLSAQAIRFSSPAVLNDPFELKPHLAALASPEYMEAELNRRFPELLREELAKLPSEFRALVSAEALQGILLSQLPKAKRNVQGMAELLMPKLQEVMARKFEELIGVLCLSEVADTPELSTQSPVNLRQVRRVLDALGTDGVRRCRLPGQ